MLDYYLDKAGTLQQFSATQRMNNQVINKRLAYMYDHMIQFFNSPCVIDLCKDTVASESHKWGLAPMHYCDAYYKSVLDEIYCIVGIAK